MSGPELAGSVLGVLGPLEQSITLVNLLRNHLESNRTNQNIIEHLIPSLSSLQHHLQQLETQLHQYNHSIPASNYLIFKTHLFQMQNSFNAIHYSLTDMEQSAKHPTLGFSERADWAEKLESIQSQINEAQHKILQINSLLGQNSVVTSSVQETEQNLIQAAGTHEASSSTAQSRDKFKSYFQKLPVSNAAKSNFDSLDSHGNPLTTEAKLMKKLLTPLHTHQTKMYAIHGPGGVGKTTCMHMLSLEPRIRQHFIHGIHYVKLGSDARAETVMNQMASIIRLSGGLSKANEIEGMKSIDEVIRIASEWFTDKKILLLVDDLWELQKDGSHFITLLKQILSGTDEGGIVFTTRDPAIAKEALTAFALNCRDPEGEESRAILFQHARQIPEAKYGEAAEGAIKSLLHTCGGLPVAHSVVGKTVFHFSIRRNVGQEDSWQTYSQKQTNILKGRAGRYDNLYSIFEAAISVLDDEESMKTHDTSEVAKGYSYKEMHRSFSVLTKQQWAPLEFLGFLWNIERKVVIKEICENLVRVGLAEWLDDVTDEEVSDADTEGILIHDLLHDFAVEEAKKKDETEVWHRRIVEGYGSRNGEKKHEDKFRQWWKIGASLEEGDGSYFMRNICRHLFLAHCDGNEVVMLVTKPEWISLQLTRNGLLRYESDLKYGCDWINRTGDNGEIGVKDLEMIRDAVRLSASYILKNADDVWFQLHGRLMRCRNTSQGIKTFLQYIEGSSPRPLLKPIDASDGLLISVASGTRVVVVGHDTTCMAVLPGDEEVVCGCLSGKLVIVSLKEGAVKRCWAGPSHCINDMVLVEKGKYIVSVSDDGLGSIWETGNSCLVRTLEGHSESITNVKVSRDEKHVYTASEDGTIRIWDFSSGRCIRILRTDGESKLREAVVLNDSDCIITGRDDIIEVWTVENQIARERETGQECKEEELNEPCIVTETEIHGESSCSAVNQDNSQMVIGYDNGSVQVWDVTSMSPIGDAWTAHALRVSSVAFSTDGTKIASGCDDGSIQVRDVSTGDLVCPPFIRHKMEVSHVYFTKEDDRIVSNSSDGTVKVWKINESPNVKNDYSKEVWCVTCSPDHSCFVTGHDDGRLQVWNAVTGQLIRKSSVIHDGPIYDVAMTADNRWIISAGADKTVRVSDWESLYVTHTFEGHSSYVTSVEVAQSQDFVVSASSYDKTVRIWDLKKCNGSHEILESSGWVDFLRVYLSDDEKRIIVPALTADHKFSVEVWSIESKLLVRTCEDSRVPWMLREEIINLAGEAEVEGILTEKGIFVRPRGHEIRYGNCSHSVSLGTSESHEYINAYACSTKHQTVAVVPNLSGRLVTLQLEI